MSLSETDITNVLQFKYLCVTQSGDGGPLTAVTAALKFQRKFASPRRTLADARLPQDRRLRLWRSTLISTLRHGCESWDLN